MSKSELDDPAAKGREGGAVTNAYRSNKSFAGAGLVAAVRAALSRKTEVAPEPQRPFAEHQEAPAEGGAS